jgi:hypothetical protein
MARQRKVALENFEKLSTKLKERNLPRIEFAENYFFHLYGQNWHVNTLKHNCTSLRLILE